MLLAFGSSAVGGNGVYLAAVVRQAPIGLAGVATGGVLVFRIFGNAAGPPMIGTVAGLAGDFEVAYALLSLSLAAAGVLMHHFRT